MPRQQQGRHDFSTEQTLWDYLKYIVAYLKLPQ